MKSNFSIGRVEQTGGPLTTSTEDGERYLIGRLLQETIISGVLAGANRTVVRKGGMEEGVLCQDIYAEPPLESLEEAQRLGSEVTRLLDRAQQMFPHRALRPEEMDAFIPAEPKQV